MKYIFPFFICALFVSCFNEGDCLITATNRMRIQFKKRSNTKLDTLVPFNSIVVSGTDSIIGFTGVTGVSDILLPLDIAADSTQFIFKRVANNSIVSDTLRLSYIRQSRVISKDCGAYTFYQGLKVRKTNLASDQIKVMATYLEKNPSSTANTAYVINYQIFY